MTVDTKIEQRLTAVEEAINDLRCRLDALPTVGNWLEQISGAFKDEPAFEEVLEFGRVVRSADRPCEERGEE